MRPMLVMKDGIVSPAKVTIEPTVRRGGPSIDRAHSSGDIWTPWAFIRAVEARFGKLYMDLAASEENRRTPIWYFDERENSLIQKWHRAGIAEPVGTSRLLWLNPPFSNITPWAKKCAAESQLGAEILLLVPMGGQNWYWDYVEPFADVYSVGRMTFDNCFDKEGNLVATQYPKDLILAHFYSQPTQHQRPQRWQWKGQQ